MVKQSTQFTVVQVYDRGSKDFTEKRTQQGKVKTMSYLSPSKDKAKICQQWNKNEKDGADIVERYSGTNKACRYPVHSNHRARKHYYTPGDWIICNLCGEKTRGLFHIENSCIQSRVYSKIMRGIRLSYLYLKERAEEHQAEYEDPGSMLMFKAKKVDELMQCINVDALMSQPKDWTILEPIRTSVNGNVFDRYLYDCITCLLENSGTTAAAGGAAGGGTSDRDLFELIPGTNQFMTDWNLELDRINSIKFGKDKQKRMEEGRKILVEKYKNESWHPLFTTQRAGYLDGYNPGADLSNMRYIEN